jgi:nitrogen regulatory protein PII
LIKNSNFMADPFETASVRLVTIIAPVTLGDTILKDLQEVGVTGHTTAKVDGWGNHGTRQFGLNDEPNIRIDTLVSAELARTILERMDARSVLNGLVAFAQDVEAVPRRHFP